MAVYNRQQSKDSQPPALPSVDIGSVLVKSLQNAITQLDTDQSLSEQITEGINNSLLASTKEEEVDPSKLSPVDKLLLKRDDKDRKEKRKQEKKRYDKEEKERKKRELNTDKILKSMNQWAQNPLQGANALLEKGLKKGLEGIGKLSSVSLGDISSSFKNGMTNIVTAGKVLSSIGKKDEKKQGEVITPDNIQTLVKDAIDQSTLAKDNSKEDEEKKEKEKEEKGKDKEKKDKEKKEGKVEKKRDKQHEETKKSSALTNLTLGKIGLIVGGIGVAVLGVKIFATKIEKWIVDLKTKLETFPGRVKAWFAGTLQKIKIHLMNTLSKIKIMGSHIYNPGTLTEKEMDKLDEQRTKQESIFAQYGVSSMEELQKKYDEEDEDRKRIMKLADKLFRTKEEEAELAQLQQKAKAINMVNKYHLDEAKTADKEIKKYEKKATPLQTEQEVKIGSYVDSFKKIKWNAYSLSKILNSGDEAQILALQELINRGELQTTEYTDFEKHTIRENSQLETVKNDLAELGKKIVSKTGKATTTSSITFGEDIINNNTQNIQNVIMNYTPESLGG